MDKYHTAQNNGHMSVEASFVLLYLRDEGKQGWGNKSVTAGVDVGAMNELLLKNIEEIYLHLFELKKENEMLREQIKELKVFIK